MADVLSGRDTGPTADARVAGPLRRRRWLPLRQPSAVLEALGLLASPLLIVWPLRAQLFATTNWLDPYLHMAVIQHGRDLLARFGPNRQFARAGLVVPGRLLNAAFGDLGGYLVFRYLLVLLAVVAAYLLLRRIRGRGAGAVAAAAVLASPVLLHAWGSDYGDSSAVSYLIAGVCFLVMPAGSKRARWAWLSAGGVLLTLALHSNAITLGLVGPTVVGYALMAGTDRRVGWRRAAAELGVLAGAFLATTGVLVGLSKLLFGDANIFSPTYDATKWLRTPGSIARYHSSNWHWALADPFLLVPPALLVCWLVLAVRRRPRPHRAEATLVLVVALQLASYAYLQFGNTVETLEFIYYLSTLWAGVTLVAALVVADLSRPLLARRATAWVPAVLVLAVPLILSHPSIFMFYTVDWTGVLIALAVVAVAVLGRLRQAGVDRSAGSRLVTLGRLASTGVLAAALVTGVFTLTTSHSPHTAMLRGQAYLPAPVYAGVINTPDQVLEDQFLVESQLPDLVPPPPHPGVPLLMWWTHHSQLVTAASAQYKSNDETLPTLLPQLSAAARAEIATRRPDLLLLLSDTGREFPAAISTLQRDGYRPDVLRTAALRAGSQVMHVSVVRLGALPPAG